MAKLRIVEWCGSAIFVGLGRFFGLGMCFCMQLEAPFYVDHLTCNAFEPLGNSETVQVYQPGSTQSNNFCQLSKASVDYPLLAFPVKTLGSTYDTLVDNGASHNILSKKMFDTLYRLQKSHDFSQIQVGSQDNLRVTLANGTTTESKLRVTINV